jgi:glycosyltransferase involved in cell wall biosynthesis
MNILIASEFFPESETGEITGGVESRAFYIARQLAKRHKVFIITSRRPGSNMYDSFSGLTIIRLGPEYEYTQSGHLLKRALFMINSSLFAWKLVRKENISVVDGYNFFTYPVPLWATLFTKARGFLTYHEVWVGSWAKNTGTKSGLFGELHERLILFRARIRGLSFISVSNFTKRQLVKQGIDSKKIKVISNGVTLSDYFKIKAPKSKQPTVCFVGRLTRNKRVEDLIMAASRLRRKIRGIKVVIVGSGPEEENLKKLVSDQRLTDTVEFAGYLPSHRDVLKRLKSSTIFCSPSVVEGFGITLVEAIASGVPYVCSDIQPFVEISEKGKGGLLFEQRDEEDLAEKLRKLLTNKALYKSCVEEERQLCQKYDWARLAIEVEEAYSGK